MVHCVFTFLYVMHFMLRKQTGEIRRGGGAGNTIEPDMKFRKALGNEA